jgi:hypothetical protein
VIEEQTKLAMNRVGHLRQNAPTQGRLAATRAILAGRKPARSATGDCARLTKASASPPGEQALNRRRR